MSVAVNPSTSAPLLQQSCMNIDTGTATPAIRLAQFARGFGNRASFTGACEGYPDALTSAGERAAALLE